MRVSDNGIGISAEQMPRLFEMFTQGDSLPIARRAAWASACRSPAAWSRCTAGGSSAHSAGLGLGSEFVVRLPLARRGRRGAGEAAAATGADAPVAPCRVLVADDLRDSADSLGLLIELMGHAVEVAYDGEEALRVAERFRPDVVLLDLGMPKLDGFEVCRRHPRPRPGARRCGWSPSRAGVRTRTGAAPPRPASTTTSSSRSIRRRSRP